MTIQELYSEIGGDYARMLSIVKTEQMVGTFVKMFAKDKTYSELAEAMKAPGHEGAFEAAHKLKGVVSSLCLDGIYALASELTECLRNGRDIPKAETIWPEVVATIERARKLIDEFGG